MHAIPEPTLIDWLERAFPSAGRVDVRERERLRSFQQQMERVRVEVTGPDGSAVLHTVYVRIYHGFCSWWTLGTPDLPEREIAAGRIAAQGGVPCPQVLYATREEGLALTILDHVSGESVWEHVSPEVAESLGEMLARMHLAPIEDEDRKHLPDLSLPAMLGRFAAWTEEAADIPLVEEIRSKLERLEEYEERPAVLVHGDCHLGNLFAEGDRISAILDWEEAGIGDPRIDVHLVKVCLQRARDPEGPPDEELPALFLNSYAAASGYTPTRLDLWHEIPRIRTRAITAWMNYRLAHSLPVPAPDPGIWMM